MAHLRPFRAFRPPAELAPRVASPPYDVLTTEEAREMARGNDVSFLLVSKPEITLPPDFDPYLEPVYQKGRVNFEEFVRRGVLVQDLSPCFYIYRQQTEDHTQTGVVAGASVDEYESGLIKKHELTRPDKEDDRTRHIDRLDANDEPVFLTYRADTEIDRQVQRVTERPPAYDFTSQDGVRHALWVMQDPAEVSTLQGSFSRIPALYVADGHHRSAAAARVRTLRREANSSHRGNEPYNFFLSVLFPHDQVKILPYNRVVRDLGGQSDDAFLEGVRKRFEVAPAPRPEPERSGTFTMFRNGTWSLLTAKPGTVPSGDPVHSLDVAVLQNNLLMPILGIEDPRREKRIEFVGGVLGARELEARCAAGRAVAFALYPTRIDQLMEVADAGQVMPPKSTWFEPKLRSGLFVRPIFC